LELGAWALGCLALGEPAGINNKYICPKIVLSLIKNSYPNSSVKIKVKGSRGAAISAAACNKPQDEDVVEKTRVKGFGNRFAQSTKRLIL
jgi:hypothetical protein